MAGACGLIKLQGGPDLNIFRSGVKTTHPVESAPTPKKKALAVILDILFDIAGSALYAGGVHVFTAANDIAPGGVTGIATIINHFTGFPIGLTSLIINIPLLLMAFGFWGKKLVFKTLKSVVILSAVMDVVGLIVPSYGGNPLLAALFGGVCMGAGLALIFIRGSTTGGTDIIGRLLQKLFPGIQTGRAILIIDFLVLLSSAIAYKNIETFLYGMVAMFTSARVLDAILYGADNGKVALIISDKKEEVGRTIISEIGRGCTFLKATGAYTNDEHNVILCAVRRHQFLYLKKLTFRVDPSAFLIALSADEIIGYGFREHYETNDP